MCVCVCEHVREHVCVHVCVCVCLHDIHSHHEQDSWYDEAWVGCVAEECPQEGWQVQFYRLHDHIKHLRLPTANIRIGQSVYLHTHTHISISNRLLQLSILLCLFVMCCYLKGPQSNEGGRVMMV